MPIDCAFAYCSSLTTINFNGTKTQWNAIGWDSGAGSYTIFCTDGTISK